MSNTTKTYSVELLTPCFCKIGRDQPEIRGSSIRGMIREWKRLLGGRPDKIWGGTGGNASKVGLDVHQVNTPISKAALLPHVTEEEKNKKRAVSKTLDAGGTFSLTLNRLVGCSDSMWEEAQLDVENWLILGCLGQRANRAAGSVWCAEWQFPDTLSFFDKLGTVSPNWEIQVSTNSFKDADEARETASDTIDFAPLFGSFSPRKPSPTKMKVIKINDEYRLLLFCERKRVLDQAISKLKSKPDPHRWKNIEFEKLF